MVRIRSFLTNNNNFLFAGFFFFVYTNYESFYFFNFYFASGNSRLTSSVVIVSGEQWGDSALYRFSLKPPSHPGCHITLSTVLVLYSLSSVIRFKYSMYMSVSNSLTIPSPMLVCFWGSITSQATVLDFSYLSPNNALKRTFLPYVFQRKQRVEERYSKGHIGDKYHV